jgi:hypothetical protein
MSLEFARNFLLWCTIINYGILTVWFLFFVFAHDSLRRLHGRWFHLSHEQFDALHYMAMAIFKIGVLILNVVPLIVLCFLR